MVRLCAWTPFSLNATYICDYVLYIMLPNQPVTKEHSQADANLRF